MMYSEFNKLTSVFYASVLLLMDELRPSIVKVVVEPEAAGKWCRSKKIEGKDALNMQ